MEGRRPWQQRRRTHPDRRRLDHHRTAGPTPILPASQGSGTAYRRRPDRRLPPPRAGRSGSQRSPAPRRVVCGRGVESTTGAVAVGGGGSRWPATATPAQQQALEQCKPFPRGAAQDHVLSIGAVVLEQLLVLLVLRPGDVAVVVILDPDRDGRMPMETPVIYASSSSTSRPGPAGPAAGTGLLRQLWKQRRCGRRSASATSRVPRGEEQRRACFGSRSLLPARRGSVVPGRGGRAAAGGAARGCVGPGPDRGAVSAGGREETVAIWATDGRSYALRVAKLAVV